MAQYIDDDDAYAAALAPTFNPPEDPTQPQAPPAAPTNGPTLVRRSATPAATTPSGNASSGAPPTTMASLPTAADRIQQLETQRDTVAGQAPDPTAAQYKPGLGTKIFRGIQGVTGGILRGGVLGGLAGGLGEDYSAPAGTYGKDLAKNQGALANIDSKISGDHAVLEAQNTQSQIDERNNKAPDTVTTADGIKQWNPQTRKYDVAVGDAPKPKLVEGEMPLGQTGPQLQKSLENRYQVLNPGKPLPPEYTLPKDATQKDYDRIDKALAGVEQATGTKNQRDQAEADRQTARMIAQQNHEEAMANAQDRMQNSQQQKGRGLLDKAEGTYRTAKQSADELEGMIDGAESGNKAMAAAVPLEGALAVNTSQGVKRINRTEVDQFAGAGSLYDKIVGEMGKLTAGQPVPKNILEDQRKLAGMMRGGAYENYKGAFDSAKQRYSLDNETPLPDPRGNQSSSTKTPSPSTHVFDSAAYAAKHPQADMKAVEAEAKRQGFTIKGSK